MAAASQKSNDRPIIIIRKKRGGHHDEHGNTAWKIAYADFVTAMMAFFLLLWLLNSVTEEQMTGISNYFAPTSVSSSQSGSGGILGGTDMSDEGAMQDAHASIGLQPGANANTSDSSQDTNRADVEDIYGEGPADGAGYARDAVDTAGLAGEATVESQTPIEGGLDPEAGAAADAAAPVDDTPRLEAAKEALEAALKSSPEMQDLAQHVVIEMTDEGLRIQVVDLENRALFTPGSAQLSGAAAKLLRQVAEAVANLPNPIKISGHTDATPYPSSSTYSNWELSADRANASRRALVAAGVPDFRVREVIGQADTEPFEPADPFAAVNRRITIVLKHLAQPAPAARSEAQASPESEATSD
ncbi:MAG: flagellar motor protein MotB [Alphaproteobacteria bacterium]